MPSFSFSVLFFASLLTSSTDGAGVGNFFTYYPQGGLGTERWPFLEIDNNQCGGTNGASGYGQSPVTVTKSVLDTCDTDKSEYSFTGGTCTWDDLKFSISNNGVKVEPAVAGSCSFGQMDIPHTGNKFNALQFHIHTFSEHQIVDHPKSDGNGYFPAELHVVHQEETEESFAVFGTMIAVSDNSTWTHPMFEWFLQGWEAVAHGVSDTCPARRNTRKLATASSSIVQEVVQCDDIKTPRYPRASVSFPAGETPNVYELPTAEEWGVFTYKGGLTTPACTEIVNWNLLDEPMEISQEQMDRLYYLILCYVAQTKNANDDTVVESCEYATVASKEGSTSRPPQPLNGRRVVHRCENGPADVVITDVGQQPPVGQGFVKPEPVEEPSNTDDSPKCDKTIFESCSDDPRYNPKVSLNLKANAPSWHDAEGYWVGSMKSYDNTGEALLESFASEKFKNTLPYPRDDVTMLMNRTIRGTRFYEHIYLIYRPASELFCSFAVPPESANVIGDGAKCGVNGYAKVGEKFGTATFEKDGKVEIFAATGRYSGATSGEVIPVDANTFYHQIGGAGFEYSETDSFTNDDKTRISGSGQYFILSDNPPYSEHPLAESYTFELSQVSVETFGSELEAAYRSVSLLPSDRKELITDGDCVDKTNCPAEEQFRQVDPLHKSSPYDEETNMKGGWIAFFVLLIALVMTGILCAVHTYRFKQQADRYKHTFARRVAETIQMDGATHEKLTAEALEEEFKRMDKEGNGTVSKADLKSFMGDKMDDKDFEVMFAAIDLDHNGTMDFSEFVAFMAQIGAIFDEEEVKLTGKRFSIADKSSKALQ